MRKTLGVNISHNVSFAYFENNILKEYYEEDRFNKIKHFEAPENEEANYTYKYIVLKKFKNITFDVVIFSSYDRGHLQIELPIIKHLLKQIKYKKYYFNTSNHHIYHATCGYYFSKFDEAIALVSDGGGESELPKNNYWFAQTVGFKVLQSIFIINKKKITTKFKYTSNAKIDYFKNNTPIEKHKTYNDVDYIISNQPKSGLKYILYLEKAGFKDFEEGQMMGIAPYKNKKTNLNKKILEISNEAQKETLEDVVELIERAKKYSTCKNIILSGGYHLNCSNNFKLVKLYPDFNFFVDPVAHDGGTAIGAVYYYENYLQ